MSNDDDKMRTGGSIEPPKNRAGRAVFADASCLEVRDLNGWMRATPCEETFRTMPPDALDHWLLSGNLEIAHASFALEIAGERGTPQAASICAAMLRHESPLVREGAALGLGAVARSIIEKLFALESDASPGARAAAADELEAIRSECL